MKYITLDKRHTHTVLFEDCIKKVSARYPDWTEQRIIQCFLHNDFHFFVCTEDLNTDVAAAVFMYGPVTKQKLIVVYADFVIEKFQKKGIGDNMTAEFMIWASGLDFTVVRPQQQQ